MKEFFAGAVSDPISKLALQDMRFIVILDKGVLFRNKVLLG